MRRPLPSRRHAAVLAGVVAAQLTIPALALAHGVPSRFGFHMYAGPAGLTVSAVDAQGRPLEVDLDSIVAGARPELDWTEVLPERMCEELDSAVEVEVTSGRRSRSLACPT